MAVLVRFRRGAWWIDVNHHNKRKSKRIGTDREAARRTARAIEERLARADLCLPLGQTAETFQAYAETWLGAVSGSLKASTLRFYRDNLNNHLYPLLGLTALARVTRADVKRVLVALNGKGLQPPTITGIVRTLSTILSEAVEDEKLPANPALRPGRLRRQMRDPNAPKKPRIDPYTREEVTLLLDTAAQHYPEWYPFLLCALRTGLRLGELRALQWGDLDWRSGFLVVSRNYVEGAFTTPKNGLTRKVDLSPMLRASLRLWRRQQRVAWMRRGRPLPDLVFPSNVETPLDDSRIRKVVLAIVKKADVRRRPKIIHVARHTFASLLIQQGESLAYVRDLMGHSSIQVTVDIYGHLVPGGNRDAVARLDAPATSRNPSATGLDLPMAVGGRKSFVSCGEPGGNRTPNPQIKSLLLCQLSYRPAKDGLYLTRSVPPHRTGVAQRPHLCDVRFARATRPEVPTIRDPPIADHETSVTDGVGAPDRIRTCGLRLRRPTLYPAELRAPGHLRLAMSDS